MKNVHIFGVFQLIWLKFLMESLNGRIQHMIYMRLSMLTGLISLPLNQPIILKGGIHGYPSRLWVGRGSDEIDQPSSWAGPVTPKPPVNAQKS